MIYGNYVPVFEVDEMVVQATTPKDETKFNHEFHAELRVLFTRVAQTAQYQSVLVAARALILELT